MNGILGFSKMLAKPDISSEKLLKYTEIIDVCGAQLVSIIDDIIDISKIEANQIKINLAPENLNSLIKELYTLLQQRANVSKIHFSYSLPLNDKMSFIITDGIRLRQILINLLNNSLKFQTYQGL